MDITKALLKKLLPTTPDAWLEALADWLPKCGIDTPHELASFLAQVVHESDEFRNLEENLNYSAERLMVVWPKRFRDYDVASQYDHAPEKLANYVYDDARRDEKHKLGNILPGDGWRFRGRGPIQLTGRAAYTECGAAIGEDLVAFPDKVKEPFIGVRVACWFWKTRNLDAVDDDEDVRVDTRKINGGETGLVRRQALFDKYLDVLLEAT